MQITIISKLKIFLSARSSCSCFLHSLLKRLFLKIFSDYIDFYRFFNDLFSNNNNNDNNDNNNNNVKVTQSVLENEFDNEYGTMSMGMGPGRSFPDFEDYEQVLLKCILLKSESDHNLNFFETG